MIIIINEQLNTQSISRNVALTIAEKQIATMIFNRAASKIKVLGVSTTA